MRRNKLACEFRRKQRRSEDQVHAAALDQMHRSCGRREIMQSWNFNRKWEKKCGFDYDCYYNCSILWCCFNVHFLNVLFFLFLESWTGLVSVDPDFPSTGMSVFNESISFWISLKMKLIKSFIAYTQISGILFRFFLELVHNDRRAITFISWNFRGINWNHICKRRRVGWVWQSCLFLHRLSSWETRGGTPIVWL